MTAACKHSRATSALFRVVPGQDKAPVKEVECYGSVCEDCWQELIFTRPFKYGKNDPMPEHAWKELLMWRGWEEAEVEAQLEKMRGDGE